MYKLIQTFLNNPFCVNLKCITFLWKCVTPVGGGWLCPAFWTETIKRS